MPAKIMSKKLPKRNSSYSIFILELHDIEPCPSAYTVYEDHANNGLWHVKYYRFFSSPLSNIPRRELSLRICKVSVLERVQFRLSLLGIVE